MSLGAMAAVIVVRLGLNVNFTKKSPTKIIVLRVKTEFRKGVIKMATCKNCKRFEECSPYTTPNESFPELPGGCQGFEENENMAHYCPSCNEVVSEHKKYCSECGQKLDWSGEE